MVRTIEDIELITYQDKVVIPKPLQGRIVAWYHLYLGHPGIIRLEASIRILFTWESMRQEIKSQVWENVPLVSFVKASPKTMDTCHLNKQRSLNHGIELMLIALDLWVWQHPRASNILEHLPGLIQSPDGFKSKSYQMLPMRKLYVPLWMTPGSLGIHDL